MSFQPHVPFGPSGIAACSKEFVVAVHKLLSVVSVALSLALSLSLSLSVSLSLSL